MKATENLSDFGGAFNKRIEEFVAKAKKLNADNIQLLISYQPFQNDITKLKKNYGLKKLQIEEDLYEPVFDDLDYKPGSYWLDSLSERGSGFRRDLSEILNSYNIPPVQYEYFETYVLYGELLPTPIWRFSSPIVGVNKNIVWCIFEVYSRLDDNEMKFLEIWVSNAIASFAGSDNETLNEYPFSDMPDFAFDYAEDRKTILYKLSYSRVNFMNKLAKDIVLIKMINKQYFPEIKPIPTLDESVELLNKTKKIQKKQKTEGLALIARLYDWDDTSDMSPEADRRRLLRLRKMRERIKDQQKRRFES